MGFFLFFWGSTLAVWDLKHRRLPNVLTLAGAAVIGLWALIHDPSWLIGGIGWATLYFFTAITVGGIGGGDIKFALGLGTVAASQGMSGWIISVLGSSFISLAIGVLIYLFGQRPPKRKSRPGIPHGPGMALATCCAFLPEIALGHSNGWGV